MSRCAEAAAVAATVPGAGVGNAGLRPPMVPRQASFFPPPVPNPFVQQTRMGAARRIQVRGAGLTPQKQSRERAQVLPGRQSLVRGASPTGEAHPGVWGVGPIWQQSQEGVHIRR